MSRKKFSSTYNFLLNFNRKFTRATSGGGNKSDLPALGLVRDGTACGDNQICINQTCSSILPFIDQTKCPSNNNNLECSGHGVRSHLFYLPIYTFFFLIL